MATRRITSNHHRSRNRVVDSESIMTKTIEERFDGMFGHKSEMDGLFTSDQLEVTNMVRRFIEDSLKEAEERERERMYWERIKDRDKSDPNYSAQCCSDKTAYFYVPQRITNVKVVRQEESWEFTIPEALNQKDV